MLLPPMAPTLNTASSVASTDNLRLAAEALFKSNSVHRSPSTQFTCSQCQRAVKCCDVSVQTSLDEKNNESAASRLRLVSLSASDDGHGNDGTWLSLDSPHAHLVAQEHPSNSTKQTFPHRNYDDVSVRSIPRMHHVWEQDFFSAMGVFHGFWAVFLLTTFLLLTLTKNSMRCVAYFWADPFVHKW